MDFRKIASFKSVDDFRSYLTTLGVKFDPVSEPRTGTDSAFTQPLEYRSEISGKTYTFDNRWAILPMEGWDCLPSGQPSEMTTRRWTRFAISGAKLLFGCEAAAVMHSGRANTRQLMISRDTISEIGWLLNNSKIIHRHRFGMDSVPYIGLQLTHSGRFSKPNDDKKPEPKTAYAHPLLDRKFHCDSKNVLTDGEVEDIICHFIEAARLAQEAGFDFVDIKSAHGYLGHEFLSAHTRPGKFGGSFENRTRFFREIVQGIKKEVPGLDIAVRLSLCDFFPYEKDKNGNGRPMHFDGPYPFAFGGDGTGLGYDLNEPFQFVQMAHDLGIRMICASLGSPYYNPHIQRPAAFPVCDGYGLIEEPLLGVSRHIEVVRAFKRKFPEMLLIGSGYTYLQEYLPLVGESVLQAGDADFIGIGRMVLAYPEIVADYLAGTPLIRSKICRTFGDCTNAPRHGLVSGCYPLDEFYKNRNESAALKEAKLLMAKK